MRFEMLRQKQRFALLLAAMLLFANALVTAHAFSESTHAVAEKCQLLHQLERQQNAPVDVSIAALEPAAQLLPVSSRQLIATLQPIQSYQSRAPPAIA